MYTAHRPDGELSIHLPAATRSLSRTLASLWRAATLHARRLHAGWQRRRLARQTVQALQGLDARTLRDLGFDASESGSIAAEITGDVMASRIRSLHTHRDLPF